MGTYGSGSKAQTWERMRRRKEEIDANPPRCSHCGKLIEGKRKYQANVRYHEQCRIPAKLKRQRERNRLQDQLLSDSEIEYFDPSTAKKGPVYDAIRAELSDQDWEAWITRSGMSDVEVGKLIGKPHQSVGRARRAATNEWLEAQRALRHEADPGLMELLGPSDSEMRRLLAEDPTGFEKALDELADAFVRWRSHFFRTGFEVVYITKAVHRHWIRAILRTIYLGERTMILSPPRHGKTDLLIHFCVWMICRNPNIRILYVGPNAEIAENCVGQVRSLLSDHVELQQAYLRPGEHWAPTTAKGQLWRDSKFRVNNRTIAQKQPTMWAAGVGGKITSLDADFIIVDDPADPDDSQTQGGRIKISKWFKMKLLTRKMRHTGLAMISSRVHFEDLYSEYVDSPKWNILVDRAHNYAVCGKGLYDDHSMLADPDACILFPEMNPIDHLQDQCEDVGEPLFEMMYQNEPRPESGQVFDIDLIKERCLDRSRTIVPMEPALNRIPTLPAHYTMVAGLDPAARGTQAGFFWALDFANDIDYMVDLQTQEAGGIEGAIAFIRFGVEAYGCLVYVIEDNGFQILYHDDPRIKALKAEIPGLVILPCSTGGNKHDPDFGVAGMATRFHQGKVNLPYGNPETVRKVDRYLRQMAVFSSETGIRSKNKSDILMASWVPVPDTIRKMRGSLVPTTVEVSESQSYPGYSSENYDDAPWVQTVYPN